VKVGLIYDPIYLTHDTGNHPENAGRLKAIISHLEQTGLMEKLTPLQPRPASGNELLLVHSEEHISRIRHQVEAGGSFLDMDTPISSGSYQAALHAAGGVLSATQAVMNKEVASAFALVRPPGHHASREQARGFCLFNNVAIAARYVLTECGLNRIAIIDFDVHHGNGTQEIFYGEPRVLYLSTHQYPFYPGSGHIAETGCGKAAGSKVNMPLPAGCGDAEYRQVFREVVVPLVGHFNPELILVSAGYDAHWADGLAMMQMTVSGLAEITRDIKRLADDLCPGRLVFTLEGGYELKALAASVHASLDILLGNSSTGDPLGASPQNPAAPDISRLIERLKQQHALA
jgi:acetoin utilization deacetylase AcuC-like enzyme